MPKIKIITIKGRSPEERSKLIEDTQNLNENIICKGSIYYKDKDLFCADIYFPSGEIQIKELNSQENKNTQKDMCDNIVGFNKTGGTGSPDTRKGFEPTPEQLERWKKIKPTKKTIELLKKKDFSDLEIREIKTMFDAHTILNSLKKENI